MSGVSIRKFLCFKLYINNLSNASKVVQVTTADHGFSMGYEADNGLYALVDLTKFYLASKSDLWPQNPGTKITANTDMYTITTPGHYYCGENAAAASLKNCPCTEAFTLTVYRGAGGPIDGMYTIQEYTSYTGNIRITQTYNMDSKNWTVHKFAFSS